MQTFLPFPSFTLSAKALDYKRLGKQRVEAHQILNTLTGLSNGWSNHPAVLMWKGYEDALKIYFNTISKEWISRGYNHNMGFYNVPSKYDVNPPWWLYWEDFHLSHQSNLIRKDPLYYLPKFPKAKLNLEYIWPSKKGR